MNTSFNRVLSAALLAVSLTVSAPSAEVRAQDAVRIGTSSVGSTFYIVAVGMSEMLRKHASINATVEPLGGSTANINGLGAEKIDLAVANAGASYDGLHGNKPFKAPVKVSLIAQGQPSMRFLLVRRDAGIKAPGDLVGKPFIAKRRALPELEIVANALVDVYGLPKANMRYIETVETGQVTDALRSGSAVAAVFPGGLYMAPVQEMFRDNVIDFLYLPNDKFDALMSKLPKYFYKAKVPANNFANQPREIWAPTLNTYLVVRDNVSADTVYKITKAVMGNYKEFAAYHADAKEWTIDNTLSEPKIAFHPGAVRYYKEVGAWKDSHDKIQAGLLKK